MSKVQENKVILNSAEAYVEGEKLYLVNALTDGEKLAIGSVNQNVNSNASKYSYRQFYLYNEKEEYLNLNELPMMFLAPEGLGINLSPTSNDLSEGFFNVVNKKEIPQGNIVGDILFGEINSTPNSAYKSYRNFADFVLNSEKLYFGYVPAKNVLTMLEEYRCEVSLEYLNKSQINWTRYLRCPISLKMLTPWYKTIEVKKQMLFSRDYNNFTIPLEKANGHTSADIKVSLSNCGINSFTFELVGDNTGKSYGKCYVYGFSAIPSDTIEYSSIKSDCYVKQVNESEEADLMDKVEISYNPWINVPTSEPSTLIITLTRSGTSQGVSTFVDVEIFEYYRSV